MRCMLREGMMLGWRTERGEYTHPDAYRDRRHYTACPFLATHSERKHHMSMAVTLGRDRAWRGRMLLPSASSSQRSHDCHYGGLQLCKSYLWSRLIRGSTVLDQIGTHFWGVDLHTGWLIREYIQYFASVHAIYPDDQWCEVCGSMACSANVRNCIAFQAMHI